MRAFGASGSKVAAGIQTLIMNGLLIQFVLVCKRTQSFQTHAIIYFSPML